MGVGDKFYEDVLGCSKKNIWKDVLYRETRYSWMNVLQNTALDFVSQNIEKKKIDAAEAGLNTVKLALLDWSENWFLSAIYCPLEYKHKIDITPFKLSIEDYLPRVWYMLNFARMRKNEIEGKDAQAMEFKNAIDGRNFEKSYGVFGEEFRVEFEREHNVHENISEWGMKFLRTPFNAFAFLSAETPCFFHSS